MLKGETPFGEVKGGFVLVRGPVVPISLRLLSDRLSYSSGVCDVLFNGARILDERVFV